MLSGPSEECEVSGSTKSFDAPCYAKHLLRGIYARHSGASTGSHRRRHSWATADIYQVIVRPKLSEIEDPTASNAPAHDKQKGHDGTHNRAVRAVMGRVIGGMGRMAQLTVTSSNGCLKLQERPSVPLTRRDTDDPRSAVLE